MLGGRFKLTRAAPVFARTMRDGVLVATVPLPKFASDIAGDTYFHEWEGLDDAGKPLPDGQYQVDLVTTARFGWRLGDGVPPL